MKTESLILFAALTCISTARAVDLAPADGSDNAQATLTWKATGPLHPGLEGHKAILLQNGMVLAAGGGDSDFNITASAQLYSPPTRTWTATGSLNTPRENHTGTLLQNGRVLLAAGDFGSLNILASAELYDPASGTWSFTGNLNGARYAHMAALLQDG